MRRYLVLSAAMAAMLLLGASEARAGGRVHLGFGGLHVGAGGHGWGVNVNLGGGFRADRFRSRSLFFTRSGSSWFYPGYSRSSWYYPYYGSSCYSPYASGWSNYYYYYPQAYTYPDVSYTYTYPAATGYYGYPGTGTLYNQAAATYYGTPAPTTTYYAPPTYYGPPAPTVAPATVVVYPYAGYERFSVCW